jgi:hypothetical protein
MTHHHHDPDRAHPPASASLSLLRMSAATRLTGVAGIAAVLWLAVWWAMG